MSEVLYVFLHEALQMASQLRRKNFQCFKDETGTTTGNNPINYRRPIQAQLVS
ncbi:MAG: hypothetical protein ACEQSK_01160 [Sphingomonadaceae bacterium]